MRIILTEPPNPGQPTQGPMQLIPMEHSEIRQPHGQLPITNQMHIEHHAMSWTVHGLQSVLSLVFGVLLDYEHVLLVLVPVAAFLPEIAVVHVGGDHFRVAAQFVLVTHNGLQLVVDFGAIREEEGASGTHLVEFE